MNSSVFFSYFIVGLLFFETFLFIRSQYNTGGIDAKLCRCKGLIKSKSRLVNGSIADKDDLKWTASIFEDFFRTELTAKGTKLKYRIVSNVCTASVITDRFLLTAAHCFLDEKKYLIRRLFVAVNFGHNMTNAYLIETPRRKFKDLIVHPNFTNSFVKNMRDSTGLIPHVQHDIALAELKEPIKLGEDILPACLIEKDFDVFENDFIIASYGQRIFGNKSVKIPGDNKPDFKSKGVIVRLNDRDNLTMGYYKQSFDCIRYFSNLNKTNSICGIGDYTNAWHGDSGGSLLYPISNSLYIVGVLSTTTFRLGTDFIFDNSTMLKKMNKPDLFTRVYPYLDWIDKYVGGENRCKSKRTKLFEFDYLKCLIFASIFSFTCLILALFYYLKPSIKLQTKIIDYFSAKTTSSATKPKPKT